MSGEHGHQTRPEAVFLVCAGLHEVISFSLLEKLGLFLGRGAWTDHEGGRTRSIHLLWILTALLPVLFSHQCILVSCRLCMILKCIFSLRFLPDQIYHTLQKTNPQKYLQIIFFLTLRSMHAHAWACFPLMSPLFIICIWNSVCINFYEM